MPRIVDLDGQVLWENFRVILEKKKKKKTSFPSQSLNKNVLRDTHPALLG